MHVLISYILSVGIIYENRMTQKWDTFTSIANYTLLSIHISFAKPGKLCKARQIPCSIENDLCTLDIILAAVSYHKGKTVKMIGIALR